MTHTEQFSKKRVKLKLRRLIHMCMYMYMYIRDHVHIDTCTSTCNVYFLLYYSAELLSAVESLCSELKSVFDAQAIIQKSQEELFNRMEQ